MKALLVPPPTVPNSINDDDDEPDWAIVNPLESADTDPAPKTALPLLDRILNWLLLVPELLYPKRPV